MKRSEINTILREGIEFFRGHGFHLPHFAYWSPNEWLKQDAKASEIVARQLGWELTDFGMNDFKRHGLLGFTLRRGAAEGLETCTGKLYAEKIMLVGVDQVVPLQMHHRKTLDLIHRGGQGSLLVQLFTATETGTLAREVVKVNVDGLSCAVPAGGMLTLKAGESITVRPGTFYRIWAAEEPVMTGEISNAHDLADVQYYEALDMRGMAVESDEPPLYLLTSDYAEYYRPGSIKPQAPQSFHQVTAGPMADS
jgi:D-lyxose ketol-isomerase